MLGQGGSSKVETLRPTFRDVLTALRPLVTDGGDLIVIDHLHGQDMEVAQVINEDALSAGFRANPKGWRPPAPEMPWQVRFVAGS